MSEIYATQLKNPGRDDYWSCPACCHDLGNVGEGTHTCPSCGREMSCSIDYDPCCISELVNQDEDA